MSRGKLTPVPWQTCLSRTSRRSVLTSGPAALRTVAGLVITHFYQGPKRQNARRGLFLSGFMFCSVLFCFRERAWEQAGWGQRERDENLGWSLPAQRRARPATRSQTKTWTKIRCLTDCATKAPRVSTYLLLKTSKSRESRRPLLLRASLPCRSCWQRNHT